MALKLTKGVGKSSKKIVDSAEGKIMAESVTEESVDVGKPKVDGMRCRVKVSLGYTENLGNYQNARYDVSLEVPSKHSEIDEVFDFASTWCDNKLSSMISDD